MRAPGFWFTPPDRPGMMARVLAPLGAIYAAGTARRLASGGGHKAGIPVICIGNLNAGGTGKTPTVLAVAQRLIEFDHAVHIVSRGHGGRLDGPVRVKERTHSAEEVGDEPLLLSAFAPVWVAKDRAAGVRAAEGAGAGVILLDDGFQNPRVGKDLSLVVVDALRGFGNGRCIPAGPLREPAAVGLRRANLLLSIGDPEAQANFRGQWGRVIGALPHMTGTLEPLRMGMDWRGQRVLAFAGIGHPEKFFATLRAEGADVVRAVALDDHQAFSDALLQRLERDAKSLGAQMVTTEKDAMRLPEDFRPKVLTLVVRLEIGDWGEFDRALADLGL